MLRMAAIVVLAVLALASCGRNDELQTPAAGTAFESTAATVPAIESPAPVGKEESTEAAVMDDLEGDEEAAGGESRLLIPHFTLVSQEPIVEAGDGGSWSRPLHNSGAVIFHNGQFHMFRNGYPSLPGDAVIGYSVSTDGLAWSHYEDNPIMRSEDVPYAEQMVMASSVLIESDGTWVLYFLIWDSPDAPGAIGRATAPSPTGPWNPDPEPVLLPGSEGAWDSAQVTQPEVIFDHDSGHYRMYFTGLDDNGLERIGLATSDDGINWVKYDDPSTASTTYSESDPILGPGLKGQWDEKGTARGRVVKSDDGYVMIYRTPASGRGYSYGLALSRDGLKWTKSSDNPFLTKEDIPNASGLFFSSLLFHEDAFYFFIEAYSGTSSIYLLKGLIPGDEQSAENLQEGPMFNNLEVFDRANHGDASDIEIQFDREDTAQNRFQVMVLKAEQASDVDVEQKPSLITNQYVEIEVQDISTRFRLPEDMADSEGDPVVEGRPYVIYVYTDGEEGAAQSEISQDFTLVNEAVVWTLVAELPSATGGIAVDPLGNIYAANIGRAPSRTGQEIYRIVETGDFELWVESETVRGASGNSFDSQGNLIQSSLRTDSIHVITPDGTISELTGEGINSPVGIAIAADGSIYVTNCGSDSVQVIDTEGESVELADDSLLSCPNGITLDGDGNVYVANFTNGRILKIKSEGEVSEFAETPGHNNGHIIFHNGLLYVVSRGSHQIFALTLSGELSLLAGSGERGHDDGSALAATFSLPNDITPSPDGSRLYINEALAVEGSVNMPSVIRVLELQRED